MKIPLRIENVKKPYSKRADAEKIRSNWTKTLGLFQRREYSSAIVRAVTAIELAANLVIREELVRRRNLSSDFVDNLMHWANGLSGEMNKIILPIFENDPQLKALKRIATEIQEANAQRNGIVHRGEFRRKGTAHKTIGKARRIIIALVRPYKRSFKLEN